MKSLFHIILLIIFCMVFNPAFASDPDTDVDGENNAIPEGKGSKREASIKEISIDDKVRKVSKKKKGNKIIISPNDDPLLELDKN